MAIDQRTTIDTIDHLQAKLAALSAQLTFAAASPEGFQRLATGVAAEYLHGATALAEEAQALAAALLPA